MLPSVAPDLMLPPMTRYLVGDPNFRPLTNYSNSAGKEVNCSLYDSLHPHTSKTEDVIFYTIYFTILFFFTAVNIVGNSIIIHTIRRRPNLRVPGYYFIFSLAISDLGLGIVYPIYNISHMFVPAITNTLGMC